MPAQIRAKYDALKASKQAAKLAHVAARRRHTGAGRQPPAPPAPVTAGIAALRQEAILEYTVAEHNLGPLMAALLECTPGEALADLHLRAPLPSTPPLCPTLQHAFKLGGRKIPKQLASGMGTHRNKKVLARLHASPEYIAWMDGYDSWVRAVVLPSIGQGQGTLPLRVFGG